MIVYKRKTGVPHPVAVECEAMEWPKTDADGETIYVNSHFATEAEAWENVLDNAKAGVSLSAREYERAKEHVAKAKTVLAEDAAFFIRASEAHEEWQRKNEAATDV